MRANLLFLLKDVQKEVGNDGSIFETDNSSSQDSPIVFNEISSSYCLGEKTPDYDDSDEEVDRNNRNPFANICLEPFFKEPEKYLLFFTQLYRYYQQAKILTENLNHFYTVLFSFNSFQNVLSFYLSIF